MNRDIKTLSNEEILSIITDIFNDTIPDNEDIYTWYEVREELLERLNRRTAQ